MCGLMIPAFFAGDFFQGVSQPGLVIVTDRRDDRDDRLDGIGRIEPSAQAGLEHDHFALQSLKWISPSAVVISKNVGCGPSRGSVRGWS